MKRLMMTASVGFVCAASTWAEPQVPAGFVVDTLLDQIDGVTPRLEAVRNPAYGSGVISAKVENGILTVQRVSDGQLETLATLGGWAADASTPTVRFSRAVEPSLYVGVRNLLSDGTCDPPIEDNFLYRLPAGGTLVLESSFGVTGEGLALQHEFVTPDSGYDALSVVFDGTACPGTPGCGDESTSSLYTMSADFAFTLEGCNPLPEGRTDLDLTGIEQDVGGAYGGRIIAADEDANSDDICAAYQLTEQFEWLPITDEVPTSVRSYRDLAVSSGGAFGNLAYVTERVTETVQSISPLGKHTVFATGFTEVLSVTITEDGDVMYVSDSTGVYRIRPSDSKIGPALIAQQPCVEADDVNTGASGVDDARFIFNESVVFSANDITVTDSDGVEVDFSAIGSNSPFMLIAFAAPILDDVYTITVADSAFSATTGAPIDGDDDGAAGGDLVVTIEHRRRADIDNSGDVGAADLAALLAAWGMLP